MRPFKPPSFRSGDKKVTITQPVESDHPNKRRRLSPDEEDDTTHSGATPPQKPKSVALHRQPLKQVQNGSLNDSISNKDAPGKSCYSVLWRKVTAKKNKTWDDDGVMICHNGLASVYSNRGQKLGSTVIKQDAELETIFTVSGKDVQVEAPISYQDFYKVLGHDSTNSTLSNQAKTSVSKTTTGSVPSKSTKDRASSMQEQMRQQIQQGRSVPKSMKPELSRPPNAAWKNPTKDVSIQEQVPSETPIPRHDPAAPGALVFKRPGKAPPGGQIVDVVLDPVLSKHLRDHQREGVKFLYECVMNLRDFGGQGCILADDMGLGKTLQTIALIWTLVKQNPIYKAEPVVKKVLIVCPVTLVQNWKKEFRKWLGRDKIGVMSFEDKGSRLSFFDGRNFKVMVVGYERLRTIAEELTRGAGIDLIVCDEGHRLKTLQNKSAKAIQALNTPRRIILSGTPIQNDLSEFFAMANFVNDGVLGSSKSFLRDFEKPIMKSRQPDATQDDIEAGQAASEELASTTSPFILRRTIEILSEYLPHKTEYVLFCNPTREQAAVYRQVLATPLFASALGNNDAALQMITLLKKLCNSPALLRPQPVKDNSNNETTNSLQTLNEMLPSSTQRLFHNVHATKIRLLDELLQQIKSSTNDKVVLVSNYTSTLNLMENLLSSSGLTWERLDGSTPPGKRQALVDKFNRTSPEACFAFLLSAKAGGQGINLIGGNRLILFDVDWNPATDDQAMARIHREGQQKPCKIYRFLVKGGLEERIWQRQVVKRGLADSIMEVGGTSGTAASTSKKIKGKAAFSREELQDLFRLDERKELRTHELIGCRCGGSGELCSDMNQSEAESADSVTPGADDVDTLDDEDDKPLRTFSFTRASQITDDDLTEQERSISSGSSPRRTQSKTRDDSMQELMAYTHIDTSKIVTVDATTITDNKNEDQVSEEVDDELSQAIEDTIDDPCLMHVLRLPREAIPGDIAWIFMKKSKGSHVDVDTDTPTEA